MLQLPSDYALLCMKMIDRLHGGNYGRYQTRNIPAVDITHLQRIVKYQGQEYACYLLNAIVSEKSPSERLGVFFMVNDQRSEMNQHDSVTIFPYQLSCTPKKSAHIEDETILTIQDRVEEITYVDKIRQESQVDYAIFLLLLLKYRGFFD